MSAFGQALKHLRAELGMAQSDLAGAVGSTQRYISFLETGRSSPSAEMVRRLATDLNLNAGQRAALFEASGMKNPYKTRSFSSLEVSAALDMIETHVLSNWHFPAFVLDEEWNLLRTNAPAETMLAALTDGTERNLFRLFLSERFRALVGNWELASAAVYFRLQAGAARSSFLRGVLRDVREQGVFDDMWARLGEEEIPIFVPIEWVLPNGVRLRTSSLLGKLATVHDALVEGFEIELMVPMDAETDAVLRAMFGVQGS